jgi:hypothetical protein
LALCGVGRKSASKVWKRQAVRAVRGLARRGPRYAQGVERFEDEGGRGLRMKEGEDEDGQARA